jgi:hypothetical protein
VFNDVALDLNSTVIVGQEMADEPGLLAAATVVPLVIGSALTVYGKSLLEKSTRSTDSTQQLLQQHVF